MNTVDDKAAEWQDDDRATAVRTRSPTAVTRTLSKLDVKTAYRRWAPLYDATFGGLVRPYRRHVRVAVDNCRASDVLEVGVGTGLNLPHYPAGTRVVGVDLCEEMLRQAQQRVDRGVAAEVELRLGDGERLDFPDQRFDLVVMLFVISVTPSPVALLDEVARVLRPNGTVLIVNHFSGVKGFRWIEQLVAPMADRIGFRSQLPVDDILAHPLLEPIRVKRLWPVGFFSLVSLLRSEQV